VSQKSDAYFSSPQLPIVDMLDTNGNSAILELGCGAGATGAAVLAHGKAGRYTGIEADARAAELARRHFEVLEADAETLDLSDRRGQYDALIISEVLEHLADPWRVLEGLIECVRPGGQVIASSPNISHWRVVRSLMMGRFDYADAGIMDRTHLRWFTPSTYRAMFEGAGVVVLSAEPVTPHSWRTRIINRLTRNRYKHLFMTQTMLLGRRAEHPHGRKE
jgi:2-polyprenyl-3-methyl-5-hydroxy-6-metoxy-1,4-benzoquinol methylase